MQGPAVGRLVACCRGRARNGAVERWNAPNPDFAKAQRQVLEFTYIIGDGCCQSLGRHPPVHIDMVLAAAAVRHGDRSEYI